MIRFYSLLTFLSIFSNLICQEKYELIGALQTNDNQLISYKIIFYEKGNGLIEGESITDFYGENSTKSKITGKIDKSKKLLSFKEVSNISTKSKANQSSFCYVNVENINIVTLKDKNILQGKFIGKFNDGKPCVDGTIYLVSATILELLNDKELSKEKSKIDSLALNFKNINQVLKSNKELVANDLFTINCNSKKTSLIIWDSFTEDNDIVTILINGKPFKENIIIKQEKQTFEIPLKDEKTTIKIFAVNEGTAPPNTMNAIIKDDLKIYPIITRLKKGESVKIELLR